MHFSNIGLVTDDQGNKQLFIPWRHVHGIWNWVYVKGKELEMYPGHPFTREQFGFIRANYTDAMRRWGNGYADDPAGHAGEQRDPVQ